ncbi:NADH-ubiquinone oxidoreductase-F iron-sulfur binding region domain-containing protein [Streptomyces sp. NPDC007206]|uniref:NADH-ubiquinone oxidoreductase-F iron-sulfur binding region domain-containing protein n=1 Tax=Streptomyces sp. NPDC007206 TaxID=3154317 RepID=UPI0033C29514
MLRPAAVQHRLPPGDRAAAAPGRRPRRPGPFAGRPGPLAEAARVLGYLAAQSARQCGPCRLGLPAVAEAFADLAWGRPDTQVLRRLEGRVGLLAGRGACRHPDGASRFAATALRVFADDVRHHLSLGPCAGAGQEPVLPVPETPVTDEPEWR